MDGKRIAIFQVNFILTAIYEYITKIIENPENEFIDRYREKKADTIEKLFLKQLKDYFRESAKYHINVCEEKGTKEHDLLVEYDNYILIIEIKSSKVREPLFNPKKAFVRIKDNFNSKSGIGEGYKQAIKLKNFIENQKKIVLYENKTTPFILKVKLKKILPIVFTLNRYGAIAINTTKLIEKDKSEPYPWVCNLDDLEYLIKIHEYLHKKPLDLIKYIEWRIKEHERLFASDELDIFEKYCIEPKVRIQKRNMYFHTVIPNICDKVRFDTLNIPYYYPPFDNPGENKQCPCGSGKKFKNCCKDKYYEYLKINKK